MSVCDLPGTTRPLTGGAELAELDALFRGFADPTRCRVLNLLVAGELCVCDIVEILGLPQPAVSRHLAYLRKTGLVDATREWKYAHYRLAEPRSEIHRNLMNCVRSGFSGVALLEMERARATERVAARHGRAVLIMSDIASDRLLAIRETVAHSFDLSS